MKDHKSKSTTGIQEGYSEAQEGYSEAEHGLACRLAAAFISYQLDIGLDYAMKRYVKAETIGSTWLALARVAFRAHNDQLTDVLQADAPEAEGIH